MKEKSWLERHGPELLAYFGIVLIGVGWIVAILARHGVIR